MLSSWKSLALSLSLFSAAYGCGTSSSSDAGLGGATATGGGVATGGAAVGTGGSGTSTGGSLGTGGGLQKPANRVVGYLPTWESWDTSNYDFDTLTHLCLAFANPGGGSKVSLGKPDADVQALVDAAHAKGVKVLISIAGASGGAAVIAEAAPGTVDAYVAELVAYVNKFSLDGIDVDVEGDNVKSPNYEPLVKKLSAALPAEKLLTAAIATWNGDDFTDGALAEYDFLNLMSYDHCGTWTSACDHSPYSETLEEINYWENTRGIAADRLVIGVPFYGYCWGDGCPDTTMKYWNIIAFDAQAKTQDYFSGTNPNNGMTYTISHNTPATIEKKADLAKMHGGIMIWELGQDAVGADSLFAVIKARQ